MVTTAPTTRTFLIFPGVGVPAIRLLDGIRFAVPYNISSCVCLVFFICCYVTDKSLRCCFIHTHPTWRFQPHPLQFLPLLLIVVLIPLLLHILKKLLPIDLKFCPVFLLPHVNLGLETLFQLQQRQDTNFSLHVRLSCKQGDEILLLQHILTLGKLFCRSVLCFSSFRRFPPLLLNREGSLFFF